MINGKTVLAYIPARSGSKSIIDKNIVDVCGKPLIAHTIEAAKGSKYVDKIIVSTDSEKYAEISRHFGAEVPFIRPDELATDEAEERFVVKHLMEWVEENWNGGFDIILRLETTSPLRLAEDVNRAIEELENKKADTVVTVTEAFTHPYWMNMLPENRCMKGFLSEEAMTKNRQQLPIFYQLDGVVNVARWNFLKQNLKWFSDENGYASLTPNERAVDVDGPIQLELVRLLLKKRIEGNNHASNN